VQLGIFEGRGPIRRKWHTKTYIEGTAFKYCFGDSLKEEMVWRVNWYGYVWSPIILIAISFHGNEGKIGVEGEAPENFWNHNFSI